MQLAAYYYPASKTQKAKGRTGFVEIQNISADARRFSEGRYPANDKREARKVAAQHNAKPWNF